ncbi:piggyBac transposable element-derived protein 4-like [Vespula maculifrons]|uniref:PiggyBac transposable element-derived protein 4-like n=1 Tax=Vespula maculifrons TaxID=7453 RepID=A0ABD2D2L2_VESMC
MVELFIGCWRNIMIDNFFTSASLERKLMAKRTILFGTIRSYRRELFQLAKSVKDELERFSIPPKEVTILNSKHIRIKINIDRKRILETIAYYNKTKFGIDVNDQMTRKYSVTYFSKKKKKTYEKYQVAKVIFRIREKHVRYNCAKKITTKSCKISKKHVCDFIKSELKTQNFTEISDTLKFKEFFIKHPKSSLIDLALSETFIIDSMHRRHYGDTLTTQKFLKY